MEIIPSGSKVLEIASGSGQQSLLLASKGCRVSGVDLDSSMVSYATDRVPGELQGSLNYRAGDARDLSFAGDSEYDYAIVTLALHAMPEPVRLPILNEMSRAARRIIIADYSTPLPRNAAGLISGSIERIAGGDHYAGFRDYQASGGVFNLATAAGLKVTAVSKALSGAIDIVTLEPGSVS